FLPYPATTDDSDSLSDSVYGRKSNLSDVYDTTFVGRVGDVAFFRTAAGAPNGRVVGVRVPVGEVRAEDEKEVVQAFTAIPEDDDLILDETFIVDEDKMLALYLDDVKHIVRLVSIPPGHGGDDDNDNNNNDNDEHDVASTRSSTPRILYTFPFRSGACTDVRPDPAHKFVSFKYESPLDPGTVYLYNVTKNETS
ncbi:hypothetical protein HK102_012292, partial [Quaeritorhiza haematococci]